MADVLLATCAALPDGGPEAELVHRFATRGVAAEFAVWDDPAVDWSAAGLVAIRTTWDYAEKFDAFVSWTRVVAQRTRLVNSAEVIAWNADKRYLHDLADWGLPVVPTAVVTTFAELEAAVTSHDVAVVKPAVGVGGIGLQVWHTGDPVPAVDRAMLVQPLVESVRSHGEVSVFVMAGAPVRQVVKLPAEGEVRVHPAHGGRYEVEALGAETSSLAVGAIGKVAARFGVDIPYGRVDLLRWSGSWVIGEIEVVEPSLYIDLDPAIAEAYVDAIVASLP